MEREDNEWVRVIEKVAECLDAGISVEEIEAGLSPEVQDFGKVIRDIDRHYIRATLKSPQGARFCVEGSYRRRRRQTRKRTRKSECRARRP